MKTKYPKECIRGISNDGLDPEGRPCNSMFQFSTVEDRCDDLAECSINWTDDDGALLHVLNQRKKGTEEIQFKKGAAIIRTLALKREMKKMIARDRLSYERKPVEGNDYHGNLLIPKELNKQARTLMQGLIASCVVKIVPQSEE